MLLYYRLESGEALQAAHPESFEIPERQAREAVPVGGLVKLIFNFDQDGVERMWVRVAHRQANGYGHGAYLGTLDSEPLCGLLQLGGAVSFRPEHITEIYVSLTEIGAK